MGVPQRVVEKDQLRDVIPVLPLRNSVFFPGGVLPLAIGRRKTITLIKEAVPEERLIGIATQRRAEVEDPSLDDLFAVGTLARIVKLLKMGEDNYSMVVQGLVRFRILESRGVEPYLTARVEWLEREPPPVTPEVEALGINLKRLAREVIALMPELPAAATELVESITNAAHLADLIAANVDVPIAEKQAVLETIPLVPRLTLVLELLSRKKEILVVAAQIDERVKEMGARQREHYLRHQLQAIQEELGEAGSEGLGHRVVSATQNLRQLRARLAPVLPAEVLAELDTILLEMHACWPLEARSNDNDD